jgi:hypothetical protein
MTRMDVIRISHRKELCLQARTIRDKDVSEYEDCAKAVLEHHFDNHEYCGEWCRRKSQTQQQQKDAEARYYRCKTKDAKLYCLLQSVIGCFIELDRLIEMAHGMDTNMNKAFNNVCTWFAPKNKVFAGSCSLHNRIGFAVGINSLGVDEFFVQLFQKLGIQVTDNMRHYLTIKERHRFSRLAAIRTKEAKVSKNKRKYLKLASDEQRAVQEFQKREGTYRSNMNIEDPFGQLLQGKEEDGKPRSAKRPNTAGEFCEYCGKKGHITSRSTKCARHLAKDKQFNRGNGTPILLTAIPMLPSATASAEVTMAAAGVDACPNAGAADLDLYESLLLNAVPPLPEEDASDASTEYGSSFEDEEDDDYYGSSEVRVTGVSSSSNGLL